MISKESIIPTSKIQGYMYAHAVYVFHIFHIVTKFKSLYVTKTSKHDTVLFAPLTFGLK